MRAPKDFSGRPSRVRFLGSESEALHGRWFGLISDRYDALLGPDRPELASEFLHDAFQRHEPVQSVLDVTCGPFSIDRELQDQGYDIVPARLAPFAVTRVVFSPSAFIVGVYLLWGR